MSTTLTAADFARAAKNLNVEIAAIRAVAEVEAAGAGFLPDGRPAILYEAHIFHKRNEGQARRRQGSARRLAVVAEMEPIALWRDRRGAAQSL